MKKNIGTIDRIVRVILGVMACIAIFFVSGLGFKIALAILGIFSIVEAVISRCALYALLGRNTCPIEDN